MRDLKRADAERAAAENRVRSLVQELRAGGASWAVVGDALGITKQAAAQRYGRDALL